MQRAGPSFAKANAFDDSIFYNRLPKDSPTGGDVPAASASNTLLIYAVAFYFIVRALKQIWRMYQRYRGPAPTPASAAPEQAAPTASGDAHAPAPAEGAIATSAHRQFIAWFDKTDPGVRDIIAAGVGTLIIAIVGGLLLFGNPLSLGGADGDDGDGDVGAALASLGTAHVLHIGKLPVPYYLRSFLVDAQGKLIPIVDCAYYPLSRQVQQTVLGELPPARRERVRDTDHGISGDLERIQEERHRLRDDQQLRRQRALQRCGLNAVQLFTTATAAPSFEAHTTRPPFWETTRAPLTGPSLRAAGVIVARNGTRYFSVSAVRQLPGSASYKLVPSLVAEDDLARVADLWFRRLEELSGPSVSHYPCLCVAHLGIVDSGLHVWFDRHAQRWRVLANFAIVSNNSFHNTESTVEWKARVMSFPALVDARYEVDRLTYSSKITVRYLDSSSFTDDAFLNAAHEIESSWTVDGLRESQSPFALVVPFNALTPVHRLIDDENENACIQHCVALDRKSVEKLDRFFQ